MAPQRNGLGVLQPSNTQTGAMEEGLDDLLFDLDLNEAERAALHAKLELLRTSDESGISLYDHLSELLAEVLTNPEPGQAVDNLERISERLKVTRVTSAGSARSRSDGGVGPGLESGVETAVLPVERDATFHGEMAMLKVWCANHGAKF
ncbi:radial spoke head protein 4 homolog A [Elysia marginata]|uniref:Radial spoke head protein 4 homolog A n=1 Tax=Elysia marginata TaxID=1093978 RepID=A0AAV4IEW7_9GAST|nr:radial spoke head protein 4 homolog A [Elysia marginata]